MANYATLKGIIDQNITTNGEGAITGNILNNVLKSIVNSIGADFLFGGVVVPTSNVGTPDQNVFFIATQGGSYQHFNETIIPNGITIFKWNGSWSYDILFAGDGGVFDISAFHNNTKYANLTAALGTNGANVPLFLQVGGLSIKFVLSSNNKYVQYSLTKNEWSTSRADWVEYAPQDKLIELVGISSSGATSNVTQVGDIYYNTSTHLLRRCVEWNTSAVDSLYETVPFYPGAIYTYENKLYTYNGSGIVADNKEVEKEVEEISAILYGVPRNAKDFPDYVQMSSTQWFLPSIRLSVTGQTPQLTEVSNQTRIIKVPVSASARITYPVFKSTSGLGCCFIDKDGLFISGYSETIEETGSYHTIDVPTDAEYFIIGLNSALLAGEYVVTNVKYSTIIEEINGRVNDLTVVTDYSSDLENGYYNLSGGVGATVDISQRLPSSTTKSIIVNCSSGNIFKVSGYGGSSSRLWGFLDKNNTILSVAVANLHTNTPIWIKAPVGTTKLVYQSVPGQPGFEVICIKYGEISYLEERVEENETAEFEDTSDDRLYNDGFLLLATKTNIPNNKQPFNLGYLFCKWNDPTQLYYGHNFNNIVKINSPGPSNLGYKFAISPKDGRIIMTTRNDRGPILVWNPKTKQLTNLSFASLQRKPMGWLYNSSICFDNDDNGNEICLFAEYSQSPDTAGGFNVWRGVYPYTSESNWQSVLFIPYIGDDAQNGITHFHQVRRDPWTGVIYLTSGDTSDASKWWYSTDHGQNFTLLTTGQTSGYEAHICRCINFLFDKNKIYFATDHGTNHCLNSVERDPSTGVINVSSRVKVADLPSGQATNFLCYSNFPKGIFMYDRWDIGFGAPSGPIKIQFFSFETMSLIDVAEFELSDTWGGHRGGCYVEYLNTTQEHPAMGFDANSPCIFVLNNPNVSKIGTIYYTILSKIVHTI